MTRPDGQKTPLEELGVSSIEEAKMLIEHGRKDHDRTGFLARKLERLERKLSEREDTVPDDDKITDPNIKSLKAEIRELRSVVSEMVVESDEELKALKPYFDDVLEEHPDLRNIRDQKTRIETVKHFARKFYEQDHPSADQSSMGNRTHRESGGPPVSTGPTRYGGTDDFKRRLEGKTREEKQAVMDQWLKEHPPDE